jgi:hypothetical protein
VTALVDEAELSDVLAVGTVDVGGLEEEGFAPAGD